MEGNLNRHHDVVVYDPAGGGEDRDMSSESDDYSISDVDGEVGDGSDVQISDSGENRGETDEEDSVEFGEIGDGSEEDIDSEEESESELININTEADIMKIDMKSVSGDVVEKFYFGDLDIAHKFYHWYERANGFSVRKSRIVRNAAGEIVQQTFFCSREGQRRVPKGLTPEKRKREQKNDTRCGCGARFRVHIDLVTRCWYVTLFVFEHNHALLDGTMCGMLPAHRKMSHTDVMDIETHGNAGIRPYQMYDAMANSAGGFHKLGFVKKDLYNQVRRQKKEIACDATMAVKYLRGLAKKDPLMYVSHTVDKDKRLERLFWCDGESRKNFEVFGDVLAFDATYRKNKYNCPFVIFSGVNHHNQTIVFATGLVTRETEETYVWLLEQFVCAMQGKTPISVITDGDLAMKNAISRVFPKAHHRLCAWHLLRNATANVGIPDFMKYLKRCMLGDIEISKFDQIWGEMVTKFGLEHNMWIKELYSKRKNWSTAHIRGIFFAGLRTTSRCEALHSHLRQFVHSRISLTNFVKQFQRCLTYFRFREIEADFQSNYGEPVIQSSLRRIEKSAAAQYTKEIFNMFKAVIEKCMVLKVVDVQKMSSCCIYKVTKYCGKGDSWFVSHSDNAVDQFKCSCLRMESIGLPCDHIVSVLVYLDIEELPKCLVLLRWTKNAKESIVGSYPGASLYWDSQLAARYSGLVKMAKDVADLVYDEEEAYNCVVDFLDGQLKRLKGKRPRYATDVVENGVVDVNVLDPEQVRTKGCGPNPTPTPTPSTNRRPPKCGRCGVVGHNKRFCPNSNNVHHPVTQTQSQTNEDFDVTAIGDVDLADE